MESGTVEQAAREDIPALKGETLCEVFQITVAERPDGNAIRDFGDAEWITWGQYAERVRSIAAGLAAMGVKRGDAVGLMLVNRKEFSLIDTAAFHLGATPFSIYNTSAPDQIEYLFSDAGNKIVITESQFVPVIQKALEQSPGLVDHIVCIDGQPEGTMPFADLEAGGDAGFSFEAAWRAVEPSDILTLIYTSGTTGPPKGVQLSHKNMIAELHCTYAAMPLPGGGVGISYLPSAHIADRWGSHYTGILLGNEITYVDDPKQVMAALPEVRPTGFGAVPRIWEKLKAGIEAQFGQLPEEQQTAINGALQAGIKKVKLEQAGEAVPEELAAGVAAADEKIFAPLRAKLGLDRATWFLSGAAPIPIEVLEWYAAIGIPITEVWGMSEISCCATFNPPDAIKLGTVGRALPGVELKLEEDGELCVRGDIVMAGYRNQPEKTAEAIDSEGWLHTGDVATIDDEGYVKIVDRKKELIINAAGKNMSPVNIESRLKSSSPLIGQAICIGDAKPYNTALLVLDPDAAAAFAAKAGLEDGSAATLCENEAVQKLVAEGVEEANSHLSRVEQIKKFKLLPVDWEPGGDELTPTMKLKRKPIAAKYAAEIEALYA